MGLQNECQQRSLDEATVPLLPASGTEAATQPFPERPRQSAQNKEASTLPEGPAPPIARSVLPADNASHHEDYRYYQQGEPEVHQVILVQTSSFPPTVRCPYCHRQAPTIQFKASGFCTWLTASMCCFIGCCLLFPFVFCCDSLKDTVHYCSHCRRYLGRTPA